LVSDIPAGDGKTANFFLQCSCSLSLRYCCGCSLLYCSCQDDFLSNSYKPPGFLLGVGVLAPELIISHQPRRHTYAPRSSLFFATSCLPVFCLDDSTLRQCSCKTAFLLYPASSFQRSSFHAATAPLHSSYILASLLLLLHCFLQPSIVSSFLAATATKLCMYVYVYF